MKSLLFSVLAAALCALPLSAGPANGEFKKMIENYWATWSYLDPAKSAVLYVKDPDAVFFDVTPLKYKGWNEYAEGVKKAFGGFASAKITPYEDMTATQQGKFAWTTDTFHAVLTGKDGKITELTGRHTAIWQKIGGKWLIVHDHVSVPMAE